MASLPQGSSSRIKRFDGTNYLAWRNRVYTELQCEDLTELVSRKPTEDVQKKTFGTTKKPLTWTQADARARRVIIENLDDSLLHNAPVDLCAFEVWKRLKITYNRTSYLQHAYLRRRLSNLVYDGKNDISLFFRDFDDIIAEIRSSGGKVGRVEDIETVVTLLAALPSDYSPVIASLGEINDNNLVTLEAVKGLLLDYDLKRKDERKSKKPEVVENTSSAYFADSPKSERQHCSYCNKEGHRENRCYKKRGEKKAGHDSKTSGEANLAFGPRSVAFLVESNLSDTDAQCLNAEDPASIEFVADSGCTRFMVGDLKDLSSYQILKEAVHISLANDSSTKATHAGVVDAVSNVGNQLTFSDVLYVPGLRRNLLSVRRIASKGFAVNFKGDLVEIVKDGIVYATGTARGELYYFKFVVRSSEANVSVSSASLMTLHRRLGHPSVGTLQKLKRDGLVDFRGDSQLKCDACYKGKQCQLPYPSSTFKTTRPLEQVVSDVCFAERPSISGHSYFVTFLDVHTHFAVVYLLKRKSEVFGKLKEYEAMATAHFGSRISSFVCDNGREFINADVTAFCKDRGIQILNTVPYNHQQNGRAERLNRTLEDFARTLLQDSGMPKGFWSEAILFATYSVNRLPTAATGRIPAVEWYGSPVNFEKMKPFGCICYIHIPSEKRLKFDARSCKGVMVGYAPLAYRVYNVETRQIQIARNVVFDENAFYRSLLTTERLDERASLDSGSSDSEEELAPLPEDGTAEPSDPRRTESPVAPRRGSRERKLPSHLDDYDVSLSLAEALIVENPRDPKWEAPMQAEMASMEKFEVWEIVDRPIGVKVLRSKWALQEKPHKLKARLVAVGCDEKEVPDVLFSPVVNMVTVKILLALTVEKGHLLHQMDVSNAFLHGNLDYKVYMEQAPGFCENRGKVCLLKKAIYGLKVSPRIWNACINEFLVSDLQFQRSEHDFCLYLKFGVDSCIFVLVYVDDLLISSNSIDLINSFKGKISKRFNIVDLGECERFLGMKIEYNVNGKIMTLSQRDFIMKIAKKFNVEGLKPVYTPLEVDLQLSKSEETNVKVPFRQLVGCLLYVSIISRPDIAFSVNFFSRYMNCFSSEHFNYPKRVVAYLVFTKDKKLTYQATTSDLTLECYVDADWGGDRDDRRSISGSVTRLYGNVVSWTSKKQSSVALSSTESEYFSLSMFIHDAMVWMLAVLEELRIPVERPVVIFEDNQGVISLSENPISSKRSKHIDVRFKFIKEMVLSREIVLRYIPTESQVADGFTKALVKAKFEFFRAMLRIN